MTTRRMGEEGFRWFIGLVEDIMDPEKLGRIKVRVIGDHDDPKITTDHLLWAYPILPITSASHQQIGRSPTGLEVGSHVVGFYTDGNEKQLPMIWGSYAKLPDGTQDTNDVPGLAREIDTINIPAAGFNTIEPPSAYAAKYPYNHVWQTKAGHVIEVDDTPSHERIRVWHKSGTYTEINSDGRRVSKIVDNDIEVVLKDKKVQIRGDVSISVHGNAFVVVKENVTLNVGGDVDATVGGKATVAGSKDIAVSSATKVSLTAPLVSINGS